MSSPHHNPGDHPPADMVRDSEGIVESPVWPPGRYEDDDLDYEPPLERSGSEGSEFSGDDGDEEVEDDVHDLLDNPEDEFDIPIEITMEDADTHNDNMGAEQNGGAGTGTTRITTRQLIQLLGADGLQGFLRGVTHLGNYEPGSDETDDEEFFDSYRARRRRRFNNTIDGDIFPKVPSDAGIELMRSGLYGTDPYYVDKSKQRKKRLATKLMYRELGIGKQDERLRDPGSISQDLIPDSTTDKIIHYDAPCYSGQFSDDGNFFYSCAQDFRVRMYDTSNPYHWKHYRTVEYPHGMWTITDATLSPDNRFLAYSSIKNVVCLSNTDRSSEADSTRLDFDLRSNPALPRLPTHRSHFGIWSIRFSGDGQEIVAGTNSDQVIVYDIESQRPVLAHQAHTNDVNAVCFGDKSSPHILYSGSDDTTVRVWDRRSLGDGRAAGVFVGHIEGVTYVDSKGDGRYVLSNGKDQMMKLWDLRKMMTTADFDRQGLARYGSSFDYRYSKFTDEDYEPHPHDCSVVSFRGHSVHRTLIRCHFSPPTSTNSRYVYSGSRDGKVYIYNMDATLAGVVDVEKASYNSRPYDGGVSPYYWRMGDRSDWETCVRDASWHPNAPMIAATSWDGWGCSTGSCTVHTWSDGNPLEGSETAYGLNYDSEMNPLPSYDEHLAAVRKRSRSTHPQTVRSRATRRRPRAFDVDEEAAIW